MITKKNFRTVIKEVENELVDLLSCYGTYDVITEVHERVSVLYIIAKDKKDPYITSSAIRDISEYYEKSKWRKQMYYGILNYTYYDSDIKKNQRLPSLAITIELCKRKTI